MTLLQGINCQVQISFSSVDHKQCSHLYLLWENTGAPEEPHLPPIQVTAAIPHRN